MSPRELCVEASEGSNFRSVWPGERTDDKVLCPMPRRVATISFSTGESVRPLLHWRSAPPSTLDCEANLELMEIFCSKNSSTNPPNFGCSPPFFAGSPPCRAGNPIIHDTEFIATPCRAKNPIVHDAEFIQQRQLPLPRANMHTTPIVQDVITVPDVVFIQQRQVPLSRTNMHTDPIVQDVEYTHRSLASPATTLTQSKPIVSAPIYRASPRVRVEGFDCPGRGFDCASRDTRRHVPAIA